MSVNRVSLFLRSQSGTWPQAKRGTECSSHVKELWGSTTGDERHDNFIRHRISRSPLTCFKIGYTHSLIFKAEDSGPCFWSPKEKERQSHNRPTGKRKLVERWTKMLIDALAAAVVVLQQQQNHSKKLVDVFHPSTCLSMFQQECILTDVLFNQSFTPVNAVSTVQGGAVVPVRSHDVNCCHAPGRCG